MDEKKRFDRLLPSFYPSFEEVTFFAKLLSLSFEIIEMAGGARAKVWGESIILSFAARAKKLWLIWTVSLSRWSILIRRLAFDITWTRGKFFTIDNNRFCFDKRSRSYPLPSFLPATIRKSARFSLSNYTFLSTRTRRHRSSVRIWLLGNRQKQKWKQTKWSIAGGGVFETKVGCKYFGYGIGGEEFEGFLDRINTKKV